MDTLRSCIVAQEGYTFISLDASQIELRVLAILSNDPQMLEDLRTGDIHIATAIRMFGWTDDEDKMKSRRYDGKQGNFAMVYGADEYKLAEMLECSSTEALEFMAEHKKAYPVLYAWMEEIKGRVRKDGFTISMFGRIRPLPDLSAGSWKIRQGAEREIINSIIQGTAVDIVKLCMLQLRNEILDKDVRMVLQVHDEVLLECPNEILVQTVAKLMCEIPLRFPDYPFNILMGTSYGRLIDVETYLSSLS